MSEEITQEVEQEVDASTEVEQEEVKKEDEPMVSVAEMRRRLKQEQERAEERIAKEVSEAERMAKMNEDEKKQHEFEKLEKELNELKQKDVRYGLSKEATTMFSEQEIRADDRHLQLTVRNSAEETQEAVKALAEIIKEAEENAVRKAMSGNTPRVGTINNKAVTRESIMAIKDDTERQKAIKENMQLFN